MTVGGEVHEAFDHVLGHDTVVDVGHKVADAVEHYQVGTEMAHCRLKQRQTVGPGFATDIEDVELRHRELVLGDSCQRDDTVAQDVLRRLLALFGVIPQHMQPSWLDPFDGEHLVAETEGHQDAADECLAALGLARQTDQLATGEAGLAVKTEEEVDLGQRCVGPDATTFQCLQSLLFFGGDAGQGDLLLNESDSIGIKTVVHHNTFCELICEICGYKVTDCLVKRHQKRTYVISSNLTSFSDIYIFINN